MDLENRMYEALNCANMAYYRRDLRKAKEYMAILKLYATGNYVTAEAMKELYNGWLK